MWFSVIASQASAASGARSSRERDQRRQRHRAAGHVGVHVEHRAVRLEIDAAGVEQDALADQRDVRARAPLRRRAGRGSAGARCRRRAPALPARDGEERAGAGAAQRRLVRASAVSRPWRRASSRSARAVAARVEHVGRQRGEPARPGWCRARWPRRSACRARASARAARCAAGASARPRRRAEARQRERLRPGAPASSASSSQRGGRRAQPRPTTRPMRRGLRARQLSRHARRRSVRRSKALASALTIAEHGERLAALPSVVAAHRLPRGLRARVQSPPARGFGQLRAGSAAPLWMRPGPSSASSLRAPPRAGSDRRRRSVRAG